MADRSPVYDAVAVLQGVVQDARADPVIRVKASELILDRILGRAPQRVSFSTKPSTWQRLGLRMGRLITPAVPAGPCVIRIR